MKPFFTVIIPLAIIVALASGAMGQTAQPTRPAAIGYVNAQRVLAEANEPRADVARVQAIQRQKATELSTKQKALEATRQQLVQTTDSAARLQLQQQELQQRTDLERSTAQAQVDVQTMQRQLQGELLAKVRPVVEAIAKERNLDLVLNAETSVIWAAGSMDITTAVIDRINKTSNASKP